MKRNLVLELRALLGGLLLLSMPTASFALVQYAVTDLGTLGGTASAAYGINNSGQVVGYSYTSGNAANHAFRTAPNSPINPATDYLGYGGAFGINNSGQVVGSASFNGGYGHAFRTAANSPIDPATDDLGTLGGRYSQALGINNSGQVVGYSQNSDDYFFQFLNMHAFLYSGSGPMQYLDNLIAPVSGWTLTQARAINDKGQIVGSGINPAGQSRAFLLSPLSTITPGTPPSNPGDVLKPVNPITTPPSGQLKRWNGTSWDKVDKWEVKDNGIDPTKPTVVIAHGWGDKIADKDDKGNVTWTAAMADALRNQNGSANILAWDWRDMAVAGNVALDIQVEGLKGAARCATRGSIEGVSLAHELQNLHIGNDNLQLIGHSNGGAVVGEAASELARGGQRVKRVTTLDAPNLTLSEVPFAAAFVGPDYWLKSLKDTRADAMQYVHPEAATQMEVYYSGPPGDAGRADFGLGAPITASYSNVFNGQVHAAIAIDLLSPCTWDHLRVPDWYSKDRSGANPGQDQFIAAIDWSILSNNSATNPWKSGNAAEQGFDSGLFKTTSITLPASVLLVKRSVDDFTQGTPWQGQHAEIVAVGNNGNYAARVASGSDGYLYRDVSIPGDASYLTFDLKIETPDTGDFLTVSLGDELVFYNALDTTDTDLKTVDPIFVGDFAGQTKTLLFALNHVGLGTPSILIDNVTFSAVPEPSSLVLLAVAGACLVARAIRRQKLSRAHR